MGGGNLSSLEGIPGFAPNPSQPSLIREGATVPRHSELVSESHLHGNFRDINPDLHNLFAQQTVKDLSPFTSHFSRKRTAFTLAEVLITLGIIGVVAALTMPVLIQNHKKTEIATSVKKFYSMMSQAVLMSEIDNGPSKDWVKEVSPRDDDNNIIPESHRAIELTYFNKYLAKYIKYVKIDENPQERQDDDGQALNIKVYLSDGTYFYMNNGECAHFMYDVNGDKKPNASARDKFGFLICPASMDDKFGAKGLIPYDLKSNNTREKAKQSCSVDKGTCSHLLMMDGWEFKSDYPHKL